MLEHIRHILSGHHDLQGEIQSHEGDIYIARLLDRQGNVVTKSPDHFHSLVCARDWLKEHGARSIEIDQ